MKLKALTWAGILLLALACHSVAVFGQDQSGGVESPFSIGFGARALGLGSAAVAFPDDPTAFLWNPAGMMVVEQRGMMMSLTTLFEGTQYNYIGYIHPTMRAGTLGIGVARIGTGGIRQTDFVRGVPTDLGEMEYWWGRLSLSYAMSPLKGLSIGATINMNRQVLGFYSTNGFGSDVGIHYGFHNESGLLKTLYLGVSVKNVISPSFKLGTVSEKVPNTMRFGLAKRIDLRGNLDRILLLFDVVRPEHQDMTYHAGVEYGWNRTIFFRGGFDRGELTFGGGLRYKNFQLDYASSRVGDPEFFPRSHRFSLVFYFGKSIPEQKRFEEERRMQDIQQRINTRLEADRQQQIAEGIQAGRESLNRSDYFNARLAFSRVLRLDENNREARTLLEQTTEAEEAYQTQREAELLRDGLAREKHQRDIDYINQRLTEGREAMDQGDLRQAIVTWRLALDRDPENQQVQQFIRQAEAQLEIEVNEGIARSRQLVRQENLSEAYKVLGRIKDQTIGHETLHNRVLREIQSLDRIVDFVTNYQEGVRLYSRGDYQAAARSLEKALALDPNHVDARERYRNALARAGGRKTEMTREVRELYNRGILFYRDERYEEALEIWQTALESDQQNVKILEAIDQAKKKIGIYKKKE